MTKTTWLLQLNDGLDPIDSTDAERCMMVADREGVAVITHTEQAKYTDYYPWHNVHSFSTIRHKEKE